jgi:hypothetical protein
MIIESKITESKNYGDKRETENINFIVIQSFSDRPTSHYHVINGKIYQVIPDDFISNSVNGPRLTHFGKYHGICTKYNSISINIDEDCSLTDIQQLSFLIMTLKRKYKINVDKIIRQMDITGEANP